MTGQYEARERCAEGCGGALRVTHTYSAGPGAQTRNLKCPVCDARYTQVAFIMQRTNGRGTGAGAVAKKIQAGELRPGVRDVLPAS